MGHDLSHVFGHGSPPRGPLCCKEAGQHLVGEQIAPVALQMSGTARAKVWRREASLRASSSGPTVSTQSRKKREAVGDGRRSAAAGRTQLIDWGTG